MKRKLIIILVFVMTLSVSACAPKLTEETGEHIPDILSEKNFIYDELETGEGDSLYTLRFSQRGYKLCRDNGEGVISSGDVTVNQDRTLIFNDTAGSFGGSFSGSAFEKPSVTLEYDGKSMKFTPDTDSGEYVYLSYLGTYEGVIKNKPAILILDRWFEYYLYTDGKLTCGTYEIFSDGTLLFVNEDRYIYEGVIDKPEGEFDVRDITISANLKGNGIKAKGAEFTYASADKTYTAQHAMGEYTLRIYNDEVFTIHGIDGFLKSMGRIEFSEKGGKAVYFPRKITNEYEKDRTTEFTFSEEGISFPGNTLLLPRSGNIDPESGYALYWSAGTELDFVENTDDGFVWNVAWEKPSAIKDNLPVSDTFLDNSMPTIGTARPLVLLIDFPDYHRPRFVTAEGIHEAMFSLENTASLGSFYYRSSYGNLTIDGTVLDWYRTEKNRDMYDSDREIMKEA